MKKTVFTVIASVLLTTFAALGQGRDLRKVNNATRQQTTQQQTTETTPKSSSSVSPQQTTPTEGRDLSKMLNARRQAQLSEENERKKQEMLDRQREYDSRQQNQQQGQPQGHDETVPPPVQPVQPQQPGQPVLPPQASSSSNSGIAIMTVSDALKQKHIELSANGSSIQSSVITLKNLKDATVTVSFPPGTYLSAKSKSVQNMAIINQPDVTLRAGETKTIYPNTCCMNLHRDIPESGNGFVLAQHPASALVSKVITLLNEGHYSYPVRQAAIWIVTDNATYNDVCILRSGNTAAISEDEYAEAKEIVKKAKAMK